MNGFSPGAVDAYVTGGRGHVEELEFECPRCRNRFAVEAWSEFGATEPISDEVQCPKCRALLCEVCDGTGRIEETARWGGVAWSLLGFGARLLGYVVTPFAIRRGVRVVLSRYWARKRRCPACAGARWTFPMRVERDGRRFLFLSPDGWVQVDEWLRVVDACKCDRDTYRTVRGRHVDVCANCGKVRA